MITSIPKQFIVSNYSAIQFRRANRNSRLYLDRYKRRLFEDIYVAQELDYATKIPRKGYHLADVYKLVPVYELQNRNNRFIRISKIVNKR